MGLSAFQALGIAAALQRQTAQGTQLVTNPGPAFVFGTVLTLTAGSVFIMWLGEQMTSRGIGNGCRCSFSPESWWVCLAA